MQLARTLALAVSLLLMLPTSSDWRMGTWKPPGTPMQQLFPGTFAIGERPLLPHWSDVPRLDTRLFFTAP